MEDAEERPARLEDFQAGLPYEFLGFLVPTASAGLNLLLQVTILVATDQLPVAAAMLDQKDLTMGLTDTPHLLKGDHWLRRQRSARRRTHRSRC